MLLSAGVKCDWDIHPIIVDPDHSNEDVSRTSILIKNYVKLRERLSFDQSARNVFFSTRLLLSEDLRMPIENTSDKRFKDYIGLSGMPSTSQALMRALFSDQDLDAEMQVGFEGNPNRGSVVLNQLSSEIASYKEQYENDDRRLKELEENPIALERLAREKYYMNRDNEDLFVVLDKSSETASGTESLQAW